MFRLVMRLAERLQVAQIVRAAKAERANMMHVQAPRRAAFGASLAVADQGLLAVGLPRAAPRGPVALARAEHLMRAVRVERRSALNTIAHLRNSSHSPIVLIILYPFYMRLSRILNADSAYWCRYYSTIGR